ncbi:GNAT family N-acetyltransferase [Symbioplanes lichenis]|uniref:GNAT family N-acetyltransferase n=1 Tax=Symbioplanes lichenis TaxID=1629072 RepID=UPI00273A1AE5|nr:GNAT family N-acetyltransferase [Actinoplanes lichenis]
MRLRPPHVDDAPAVLALARDPDVRLWNPRCRIPDEPAAVAACLADADWTTGATFSILDEATGTYAGTIALHDIDPGRAQAHIGYRIAPWTRERGLATACVRTVAGWASAKLGMRRIVLTHAVENIASCRVAEKAGFALTGTTPASKRFGDGLLHDEHVHALT